MRGIATVLALFILFAFSVQRISAAEIHDTVKSGNVKHLQELVKKQPESVNSKDGEGNTPLVIAAVRGNKAAADILINAGADINAGNKDGDTPLIIAIAGEFHRMISPRTAMTEKGRYEIVRLLLDKGVDVNKTNNRGMTAMFFTAFNKRGGELAELLVMKGASVTIASDDNRTPLHIAALHNNTELAAYLISKGANVHVCDIRGRTPLHKAADWGSNPEKMRTSSVAICETGDKRDMAALLLKNGAHINGEDNDGNTPLHIAAVYGDVNVTRFLVEKGADTTIKNRKDRTALKEAEIHGNKDVAEFLKSRTRQDRKNNG